MPVDIRKQSWGWMPGDLVVMSRGQRRAGGRDRTVGEYDLSSPSPANQSCPFCAVRIERFSAREQESHGARCFRLFASFDVQDVLAAHTLGWRYDAHRRRPACLNTGPRAVLVKFRMLGTDIVHNFGMVCAGGIQQRRAVF